MNENTLKPERPSAGDAKSGKGCPVCGGPLIHAEGCLKCLYCGYGLCD